MKALTSWLREADPLLVCGLGGLLVAIAALLSLAAVGDPSGLVIAAAAAVAFGPDVWRLMRRRGAR